MASPGPDTSKRTRYLEEDPNRQTKRATWIEDLNFEYCWHDQYTWNVESLERKYNKARKSLVESEKSWTRQERPLLQPKRLPERHSAKQRKPNTGALGSADKPRPCAKYDRGHIRAVQDQRSALKDMKRRWDLIVAFVVGHRSYQVAKERMCTDTDTASCYNGSLTRSLK
ncbi:hypothetical protein BT67DRAFT_432641 [Trichocladium antarcticum]|uniref:Uncharacterized protein n=1 Tax=Trichocladium antarcticum TaxID=1450529 RepID=A0AAN6UPP7_9PEZI|nr:hypothetical protein BT67DRAFT_432641 [Trichocladium antarcticum]